MRDWEKYKGCDFSELKGKTITEVIGLENRSEQIFFNCSDGSSYRMMYHQDCCANCDIEDVAGDVSDLIGQPVLLAEEISSTEPTEEIQVQRAAAKERAKTKFVPRYEGQVYYDYGGHDSETWTFYKLSTIKGSVTIRWYGSSNGYYSESASFEKEVR